MAAPYNDVLVWPVVSVTQTDPWMYTVKVISQDFVIIFDVDQGVHPVIISSKDSCVGT